MHDDLERLKTELRLLRSKARDGQLSDLESVRLDVVRRLIVEWQSGYAPISVSVAA